MSQVPIGAAIIDSFNAGHGQPLEEGLVRDILVQFSQFTWAEMMAERWKCQEKNWIALLWRAIKKL